MKREKEWVTSFDKRKQDRDVVDLVIEECHAYFDSLLPKSPWRRKRGRPSNEHKASMARLHALFKDV